MRQVLEGAGGTVRFENVVIVGVGHVDAPHRMASEDIDAAMHETYHRLGFPRRLLETLTGVRARRFWGQETLPSGAATLAAHRVLAETGVERSRIGVLINTSVCRDYVEPSVACFVHANLGLSESCLNFDVSNACLGFLDGMAIVGNMIERGQVDYGLVVDAESSRTVVERTIERLSSPSCDEQMLRQQLPTLTVGSGAAAMVLAHARVAPVGHRFVGGVSVAATEHNGLCHGQLDVGITDAGGLLVHGVALAGVTWARAQAALGWSADTVDLFALHQVSEGHTEALARALGFDRSRAFLIYPELGNVGPASVPIALSKALEAERLAAGDRVILGGIGSGLNCTAAGVIW
jgi:3-oxoacyl-[acyl-carrier-protein] synthase III